jgi:hypothetical protein
LQPVRDKPRATMNAKSEHAPHRATVFIEIPFRNEARIVPDPGANSGQWRLVVGGVLSLRGPGKNHVEPGWKLDKSRRSLLRTIRGRGERGLKPPSFRAPSVRFPQSAGHGNEIFSPKRQGTKVLGNLVSAPPGTPPETIRGIHRGTAIQRGSSRSRSAGRGPATPPAGAAPDAGPTGGRGPRPGRKTSGTGAGRDARMPWPVPSGVVVVRQCHPP